MSEYRLCCHIPTGTVSWPTEYTGGIGASCYCCPRPVCVTDAARWVAKKTGHDGVYRPFTLPDPDTRLIPHRIQLRRAKGWLMPLGAVSVARPSKWGNPWRESEGLTRAQCAEAFRCALLDPRGRAGHPKLIGYPSDEVIRKELVGKILCCWCPIDEPCHADTLLVIANGWIT